MAGELSFFELGVGDPAQGREFYRSLFGWSFEPSPGGDGFVVDTPNIPGGMHGGDAGGGPYLFFAVDDLDAAVARVRELGGSIESLGDDHVEDDPDTVPRFGRFRLCRDDQGSPFGLHQRPSAD
ncbi:VOC family protein [Rhodococcus triatomae]|uniref:Uncharacterized protein n=1 Tax=Rhodococcus triatomae TaxID=300028 RepID=A0A1G8M9P6_9NOCA|nr:VOC family protein [Rhodococcus triatomae]QNG18154.1 VOC family protein [Rhodococcus triatomae]QNG22176.1 VOC family protein [Rhodococcus triatomae]SDI64686.1 hypothetical protein SAMN05444695_109152 [Rhodococcus triatomae]